MCLNRVIFISNIARGLKILKKFVVKKRRRYSMNGVVGLQTVYNTYDISRFGIYEKKINKRNICEKNLQSFRTIRSMVQISDCFNRRHYTSQHYVMYAYVLVPCYGTRLVCVCVYKVRSKSLWKQKILRNCTLYIGYIGTHTFILSRFFFSLLRPIVNTSQRKHYRMSAWTVVTFNECNLWADSRSEMSQ